MAVYLAYAVFCEEVYHDPVRDGTDLIGLVGGMTINSDVAIGEVQPRLAIGFYVDAASAGQTLPLTIGLREGDDGTPGDPLTFHVTLGDAGLSKHVLPLFGLTADFLGRLWFDVGLGETPLTSIVLTIRDRASGSGRRLH